MSVRLEWTVAEYASPSLHGKGEELADGNIVTHPLALSFGSEVIEGTRDELLGILHDAYTQLGAVPVTPDDEELRIVIYNGGGHIGPQSAVPAGVAIEVRDYDVPDDWDEDDEGCDEDEEGDRYERVVYRSGGRESTE